MEAEELTNDILAIKNIIPTKDDIWATFEVIENEELGKWFLPEKGCFCQFHGIVLFVFIVQRTDRFCFSYCE